jgi:adenine-specific DNA-methyltransferase
MNYIGSKFSLLPDIKRVIDAAGVPPSGIALDLFAGTGVVAQLLKKRGHVAYANDWQYYSYLTCVAFLEHNQIPQFHALLADKYWGARIQDCPLLPSLPVCLARTSKPTISRSPAAQLLSYLSQIPGKSGIFCQTYCEGGDCGRLYFSKDNGARIQAIRDQVGIWSQQHLLDDRECAWIIASLLEGADRVANTASVYGAYLKHLKQSAKKPLQLYSPVPVSSDHPETGHRAFCENSEQLLHALKDTRLRLVYIDPPYNSRQYNANYHILETIARWDLDQLQPRGVTGLRKSGENRSDYCRKPKVLAAFRRLLGAINADYVLFSYSNEGLVSRHELEAMFCDHCSTVRFEEIPYRRFRADSDGEGRVYRGDSTLEYLILGELKGRATA